LRTVLGSKFDARAIIWDVADIPTRSKLGFFPEENRFDVQIEDLSESISLNEIRSVWWRRPNSPKISSAVVDPKLRRFCQSEYDTFFKGILHSLRIPIINDPAIEGRAVHKPFQLTQAREVGLDIPKTIMSNDPETIVAFWNSLSGNCVYKAFNAPPWAFTETRHLTFEDLQYLDKVRHAPIIVQEKIDKGVDVRVNIFGKDVFAAEVTTNIADADLDWRIDMTAKWEPHCLPEPISSKLRLLLNRLGLQSGNIDLRRQTNGTYKFFEVNPSGQFLFVEIDTGQPLLESLSKLLMKAKMNDAIFEAQ
jgi:glutathione synthase/RimK-type ligase-like ATP-grasp enzyme